MPFDPATFEKLGAFYLGRELTEGEPKALLYDSRDLVTHAVCLGMTGSGKTGLCLALLEEAALDGVPAIIIDPKGDLGNLLLTFPNLEPADFAPWINPDDARRAGQTDAAYSAAQAKLWREGLQSWGQSADRIQRLREAVDMAIYTPGSSSGIPVNILSSFAAPSGAEPEEMAERAQALAAGLLGLMRLPESTAHGREGILIAALISHAWQNDIALDLAGLIEYLQTPPFSRLGVLDIETFFPAKDRFQLVLALNNLLASPSFAAWRQGEALDIGRSLFTATGQPRMAIFSIAHLDDADRMFFVSLLLNEVLSWTRRQSGTSSLRAIIYMDEIFGYLPPTAAPPSKRPLLTLLKQGRAFGVGVVLATQNPVDLDYKALSNAGTWFIGRLQTERDKARVLEGLQSAAGERFDRDETDRLLAGLGKRVFLLNNIHDPAPRVFETRWAMSYLSGPLTREQIRRLTPASEPLVKPTATPSPTSSPTAPRPALAPTISQVFFPAEPGSRLQGNLLTRATVSYRSARHGFETQQELVLTAPIPAENQAPAWIPVPAADSLAEKVVTTPPTGVQFVELPAAATREKNYGQWEKACRTWITTQCPLEFLHCRELKLCARPDESPADFHARVDLLYREERDRGVEKLRDKYAAKQAALRTRLSRAEAAFAREKEQAGHAKLQTAISFGSTLLGAFLGRRAVSSRTLGGAASAARGVSRSMKEGADVARAADTVESVRQEIAELDAALAAEMAKALIARPQVDTVRLLPARTGLTVAPVQLAWLPV